MIMIMIMIIMIMIMMILKISVQVPRLSGLGHLALPTLQNAYR